MNREVLKLCTMVREEGGRAMLVGGSVRDQLLGVESKDFDVEVYGIQPERLREVLERLGQVNRVGEHFSVYKLVIYRQIATAHKGLQGRIEIDVSLPRRESKSGPGHRGFVIEGDPSMSFEQAARRRDFTINAILLDPLTNEIIDPFGGKRDFERRVLKAVADDTFVEDSLRVLRAVQLAARFEMTIEPATVELCRKIDLLDLPSERIWGEVEKLLTLAVHPSIGLAAALELGVLDKLFPEIRALADSRRDNGEDCFTHTKRSMDEATILSRDLSKPKRITVMLAVLCHELREPSDAAAPMLSLLNTLGLRTIAGYDARSQILALVREFSRPRQFYYARESVTDGDFRRLAARVDLDLLYRVAKACARAQAPSSSVAEDWFIERARELGVEHGPPAPVLQGRHLVEAGFEPGPEMGRTLRRIYELQLDGKITTLAEALAEARSTN